MKYTKKKKSKYRVTSWLIYRRVFVTNHRNALPYGPIVEVGVTSYRGLEREHVNRKRKVTDTWKRAYRLHHIDWRGVEE